MRILLVEKDDNVRNVLSMYLTEEKHFVRTVNTASKAIMLLKTNEFDVVISDYHLDDFREDAVFRYMNMIKRKGKKILLADGEVIEGLRIVKKPFKFEDIEKAINEVD